MMEVECPQLLVAQAAARRGGEILTHYYHQGVTMRSKSASDLVSDADIEAEQAIAAVIRESFPDDEVLGEESHRGDSAAARLWIVDPLDGTTNFAHHIPHFAVSIAYYESGKPQCGVIYNPLRGDWYTAEKGQGAWWNGERASVGAQRSLSDSLVGVGFYYDRGALMEATLAAIRDLFGQQIHGIRRFGTASLDLCQVGVGMFGAFFEYVLSPWDFAAGRLFVEEAGGTVTNCLGEPLPLSRTSVLASNGHLHQAVQSIVSAHYQKSGKHASQS